MSVEIGSTRSPALLAALHAQAFDAPWSEAEFARLLDLPNVMALTALAPAPVGFVLAWASAGEGEILTMGVAPGARRSGAGRALVRAALRGLEAQGALAVFLEVRTGNDAARALYQSAGFEEQGVRKGYYSTAGGRQDALILRRNLSNGLPP